MTGLLADHRHAYDLLVEHGEDPAHAACTYEWHCTHCGATNYLSAWGGVLDSTGCDPCAPEHLQIHVTLAGERWSLGTFAELLS